MLLPGPAAFGQDPVSTTSSTTAPVVFNWEVVVNNGVYVPDGPCPRRFNSYNQPSVNVDGLVVFRGRSKGGTCQRPAHGVFTRDMAVGDSLVVTVFDRNTFVPDPNNLGTMFVEPPSFPRIDMWADTIASRANHQPVWEYPLSDRTLTRGGTTGIYANPFGGLVTGASNLSPDSGFDFFAVPEKGVKFDVFPGAPAVTDGATIVFKGNYTVNVAGQPAGKTGVYYRKLANADAGGAGPVILIANSDTYIPNTTTPFGSTAPPSAAAGKAVFAGFDNEDNPAKGGIYMAKLSGTSPKLNKLVTIGAAVPGEKKGVVFNRLGEGVSFDGRFVAFWGAWGSETQDLTLQCPDDGNAARLAYCKENYPNGYPTTVPKYQGIFVHDTISGSTTAVAKTPGDCGDFVYWNFSGLVPGTGESDDAGEPARWRSATFVAVSGLADGSLGDATFHVAFKARKGSIVNGAYVNPIDGIYLRPGPGNKTIYTLVETGWDGTRIDPNALDPLTGDVLPVTSMGVERDGFRGKRLAINVSMGTEEAGWAGVYLTRLPAAVIQIIQ
jgi:hypothetical protein